jgi:hypothetical protein
MNHNFIGFSKDTKWGDLSSQAIYKLDFFSIEFVMEFPYFIRGFPHLIRYDVSEFDKFHDSNPGSVVLPLRRDADGSGLIARQELALN